MPPLNPIPPGPQFSNIERPYTPKGDWGFNKAFPLKTARQYSPDPKYWSELKGTPNPDNQEVVGRFYGEIDLGDGDDVLHLKDFSGRTRVYMGQGDNRVEIHPSAKAPHDIELHGGEGHNNITLDSTVYPKGMESKIHIYRPSGVTLINDQDPRTPPDSQTPPFVEVPMRDWSPEEQDAAKALPYKITRHTNKHGMTVYVHHHPEDAHKKTRVENLTLPDPNR